MYILDVSHVYHFSHSLFDDEVENEMSKERLPKGDHTPNGELKMYTGAPYFKGFANFTTLKYSGKDESYEVANDIPATTPFLKPSVTIYVDKKTATKEIIKCLPRNWPVYNEKLVEDVLNKIKNITIQFDGIELAGGSKDNSEIPLIPGYIYTFTATIALSPQWKNNIFDYPMIDKININIKDANVMRTKSDYFSRHQAIVQYQIEFDDTQEEMIIGPKYFFTNFVTDVMAISSIVSLGAVALTFALKIFGKDFLNEWKNNVEKLEKMRETKRIADVVEIVQDGLDNPMVQKELQKRRGHRKVDYSVP